MAELNLDKVISSFKKENANLALAQFLKTLRAMFYETAHENEVKQEDYEIADIYLKFPKVLKRAKVANWVISEDLENVLYDTLFIDEWKHSKVNYIVLQELLKKFDVEAAVKEAMEKEIEAVNFDKKNWLDTSWKIQKIFSENERLKLVKEVIKEQEASTLEADKDYQAALVELEEVNSKVNEAYEKAVSKLTVLDKLQQIKEAKKENDSILDEMLEFEKEHWNLSSIEIIDSKWRKLKAATAVYLAYAEKEEE